MQLPTDLGSVRGERGCDMQWDRKDHLRLAESQTHLVVLGECCGLGFAHHWLLLGVCPRHLVHDLFATQRHRVLYTGNDSTGKVQCAHDVLSQSVGRLEETESAHDATLIGD